MFDEPSSYLDVKQRLNAARMIRSLLDSNTYVIAVEHDLSVLDYLSDFICCLYGVPSVYGVVTVPSPVRDGINIFLDGYIPAENMRFRDESLTFKIAETADQDAIERTRSIPYPSMTKKLGNFSLEIEAGDFSDSEIIVFLGENGTGKTTFVKMLAGKLEPDTGKDKLPQLNVSLKPQTIAPKFQGTVRMLLLKQIKSSFMHPQFQTDVVKPLRIEPIIDQDVQTLSGGELQRVALVLALGKPADVYLIDEPSAYLDAEQRVIAARVIKRFILHAKKTAMIIEHDIIMATYLADRVIVYEGQPSVKARAKKPESLLTGMNSFLANLEVTLRRDPTNFRPRVNKFASIKVSIPLLNSALSLLLPEAATDVASLLPCALPGQGAEGVGRLLLRRLNCSISRSYTHTHTRGGSAIGTDLGPGLREITRQSSHHHHLYEYENVRLLVHLERSGSCAPVYRRAVCFPACRSYIYNWQSFLRI